MDIHDIISELQNSQCCQCKIGKALIALKGLDRAEPSQPVTPRNTAKPALNGHKQVKKAEKVHRTASKQPVNGIKPQIGAPGETRNAILNYLAAHPSSKTRDIAEKLELPLTTVSFHTSQLNKAGLVVSENRTWRYVGKPAAGPDPAPERLDDEDDLVCKLCNSPCASKERLARHMQLVHNR